MPVNRATPFRPARPGYHNNKKQLRTELCGVTEATVLASWSHIIFFHFEVKRKK